MNNRYHVDRRTHRYRRARRRAIVIALLLFLIALFYFLFHLRIAPSQNIQNDTAATAPYKPNGDKKAHIDKPFFAFDLPDGWKEAGRDASVVPSPTYNFISPTTQQQTLRLYVDASPANFAVNRAITVSASGSGIDHDMVSENCVNFTDAKYKDSRTGIAPAKWQNIDFLCDMANIQRPVVGAISSDGINYIKLTGPTTGEHKLFIVFADYGVNPNYSVLYDILDSFKMK
ncbi:hypothetical protein KDA06_02840 [Candidatus Saccharibacteria bacterium]|nr:hypothetical protein [Candidatus Saccharibacteria bacterium]